MRARPFNSGYFFRNKNHDGTLNYFAPNIIKRYQMKAKK